MTRDSDTRKKTPPRKAPYNRPELTVYGSVGELTTGGSGHAMESSSGRTKRP